MYRLYSDASGGTEHPGVIVAGYFAHADAWELFDADWRLVLAKYGVPYFHMSEFAHSRGAFERWKGNERTRRNFLADLVSVIKHRALFGVACAVRHSAFVNVNQEFTLSEIFGNEYALCGRDCVAQAGVIGTRKGLEGQPVEYVFEDGDEGKQYLIRSLKRDKSAVPIFKPARLRNGEPGLTPLQAADFAAYELLKAMRMEDATTSPLVKYRQSLRALASIDGWWGQYTEADLRGMCEKGGISRRDRNYADRVAVLDRQPHRSEIPKGGAEFLITTKKA